MRVRFGSTVTECDSAFVSGSEVLICGQISAHIEYGTAQKAEDAMARLLTDGYLDAKDMPFH